jgi:type I restriction enzyme, S subunit
MLTHRAATILGDIPPDWDRDLLVHLLEKQQGGDWGDDDGEVAIKVLRSTNFTEQGFLDFSDVATRFFKKSKAETLEISGKDLLLERSGGGPSQPVGRIGFVPQDLPDHWFSNFVQLLRPNTERIYPDFLGWVLFELNRCGIIERLQHQTTQMRNLDFRDYLRVYLPKPKMEEQISITKILNLTLASLFKAEEKLKFAKKIKTALLQKLFVRGIPGKHKEFVHTKWFNVPSSWSPKLLRQIAKIESGFTMGRNLSGHETMEVSYLTVINVQEGGFDLSNVAKVEVKKSELEGLLLLPGDILMTEGGDRDKLGRGGLWLGAIQPCVYQNHIFRVRLTPGTYKPELFHFLLQTWGAKNYFYAHAKQTSNLCTINSRELKHFPIFEPPEEEQNQMIEVLRAADSQVASCEDEITVLQRLKRSLLQNLLTGKVRVKTLDKTL